MSQAPSSEPATPALVIRSHKKKIPVAFREQIWIRDCGRVFDAKCRVPWCQNRMTVFDFQSGHNVPESKGGPTTPKNLIPICARCNTSMGDRYTITQWSALAPAARPLAAANAPLAAPSPTWWCCV